MHREKKPLESDEIPAQFQHLPELQLCWRGLVISISEGFMTRKQAVHILNSLDRDQNREEAEVIDLRAYQQEPPDMIA